MLNDLFSAGMIPEFGFFALILACALCTILFVLPLLGAQLQESRLMHMSRSVAVGFFFFTSTAFFCLAYSFVHDDFTVKYVAENSNSLLPTIYKFCAVWGGHEGSLLLWIWILSVWTLAVSLFSKSLPLSMQARVLSVLGFVAVGFLLFILCTSNPFTRTLPFAPQDGSDLNPLLQDPGFVIHPPMLYMGYVGFSVCFAFAIAALIESELDSAWARWVRPWATMAWGFLSVGIALGSWWAYYELGWGGWWFWDPVENASFMPWLVGTALIHSLAVTEKRGLFKNWTLLLSIFAFSLSLLGTFLVRSGVLTSVHAFTNDPTRGYYVLGYLGVVVGSSLLLFALRAPDIKSEVGFQWLSKETFLLINNVLLIIVLIVVLLGTLSPLVIDAMHLGKISVGPPYFNKFFIPLMTLLCLCLAIGPIANWKNNQFKQLGARLWKPWIAALIFALIFPSLYGGEFKWQVVAAVFVASWIFFSFVADLIYRMRHAESWWSGIKKLSLSYYAMQSAHLGIAVTLIGICLSSHYNIERDLRVQENQIVKLQDYEFRLVSFTQEKGPNYLSDEAHLVITKNGKALPDMYPEKRRYYARGNYMTEVALDPGLFRDIYVAMGESVGENAWAMRFHIKPFVRWIWLGALMMAFGACLAVADKRYRKNLV